ncbi:HAD family hydrolase [Celerinatantimonas yamalensis]|uniref:HAD family hydrolase n=1 Tax=Celerinatantimonas yamalensis TaxID=559956 RepID=A0ABW9G3S5_9GAMM
MIRAIYFDLDNTLVDRAASIGQFAQSFVCHYAHHLSLITDKDVSSLIRSIDQGGYLPKTSPYQKIYTAIGCELSEHLPWNNYVSAEEISAYWQSEFPQSTVEMDGAKALIERLTAAGYYVGIISNGAEKSRQQTLKSTSFAHLIRELVSSQAFGLKKPNPKIFIETARNAGFRPDECLYVGDHPENDRQAALNAGMSAVLLSGFHPMADAVQGGLSIEHLSELINVLNTLVHPLSDVTVNYR